MQGTLPSIFPQSLSAVGEPCGAFAKTQSTSRHLEVAWLVFPMSKAVTLVGLQASQHRRLGGQPKVHRYSRTPFLNDEYSNASPSIQATNLHSVAVQVEFYPRPSQLGIPAKRLS